MNSKQNKIRYQNYVTASSLLTTNHHKFLQCYQSPNTVKDLFFTPGKGSDLCLLTPACFSGSKILHRIVPWQHILRLQELFKER